ncbi:MAG: RDD family protein [Myxococcota bacterium]
MLPPTDEHGRFVAVLRDGSILKRLLAKPIDLVVAGVASWGFSRMLPLPAATAIGMTWLCLSDWSGSPGKWVWRLKTVMLDGSPVTALASIKRNVVLALPTLGRSLIVAGWSGLDADASKWDRGILACVGLAVAFGELMGILVQPMNRRWGDVFAGTRVVER